MALDMELVAALEVFKRRNDLKRWHDCCANLYRQDKAEGRPYVKEYRTEMTRRAQVGDTDAYGFAKKSYIITARDNFDDFMVSMEWNRAVAAKFWLPRRRVLEGQHKVASQIQDFMDDPQAIFLGICAPPGVGKSTLIKFLLAYIFGKYYDKGNMYVSYVDGMVKLMYDSLSSMLFDPEYCFREIFPDIPPIDKSAEYATFSCRAKGNSPTLSICALGGSITGRTRATRFLVTDDLVKNAEFARSPERLGNLCKDYDSVVKSRAIGDKVKQIMLGTIWSIHDPLSQKKAKHAGDLRYRFIILPVCDEAGHSNFMYDHEDRYTDETIAEIKSTMNPVDFSCLYMQRGIEKEGLAFSQDNLKYYNGVLPDGEPDNILFFADVAWGGGDNFSMPIGYVYGSDVYIHDVIFDQRDKSVTRPRVIGKILRHKIKMGRFEANNGGGEYADKVSDEIRKLGYSMNIGSKNAPGNMAKLVRIEQHQDTIRTYYYRAKSARDEEYERFMEGLTTFSFTSKNLHDDAPDSLAGLSDFMNRSQNTATIQKRSF